MLLWAYFLFFFFLSPLILSGQLGQEGARAGEKWCKGLSPGTLASHTEHFMCFLGAKWQWILALLDGALV